MKKYYLLSLKYTHRKDLCFSFWRPLERGYSWFKRMIGEYTHEEAEYIEMNNPESVLKVPVDLVENLFVEVGHGNETEQCIPISEGTLIVLGINPAILYSKHSTTTGLKLKK